MDTPVSTRTALLQALISRPAYGLQLIDKLKASTGIVLGQGTVYPLLREMEREGLITSWEDEPVPERGGRPRRYYELTAEGLRVARDDGRALAALLKLAEEGA